MISNNNNSNTHTEALPNTNSSVLLQLYHYSQHSKPSATVKMLKNKNLYPELNVFRQQIEYETLNFHSSPYSCIKKKVALYKIIFFLLAVLFFGLGAIIYQKALYWSVAPLSYNQFFMIKNLICGICAFIGSLSLWIFGSMRAEQEASRHLLKLAHHKLNKSFARKRVEFGLHSLFLFGNAYKRSQALKQAYQDARHRMQRHYENLHHLFKRISTSSSINARVRELLCNQAILEFGDQMDHVVSSFKEIRALH